MLTFVQLINFVFQLLHTDIVLSLKEFPELVESFFAMGKALRHGAANEVHKIFKKDLLLVLTALLKNLKNYRYLLLKSAVLKRCQLGNEVFEL